MTADAFRAQVSAAINAHALWKAHLGTAITLGSAPFRVEDVGRDDRCKLGQWLHGLRGEKNAPQFEEVRALHARFHQEAAQVLDLALAGKADEARARVAPQGEYATLSGRLVEALMRWSDQYSGGGAHPPRGIQDPAPRAP